MILALGMSLEIVFTLKPLGAFQAEMSAQARKVLYILGAFVLLQVTGRLHVRDDLIIVPTRWSASDRTPRRTLPRVNVPGAVSVLDLPGSTHCS